MRHMTEFEQECRARVDQLRTAFVELYDSIGADPGSPQDVSPHIAGQQDAGLERGAVASGRRLTRRSCTRAGHSSLEKVIQASTDMAPMRKWLPRPARQSSIFAR